MQVRAFERYISLRWDRLPPDYSKIERDGWVWCWSTEINSCIDTGVRFYEWFIEIPEPKSGKSEGGDIISCSCFECICEYMCSSNLPKDGLSGLLLNLYWQGGLKITHVMY